MKVDDVNSTAFTEFFILGFPELNDYKLTFFSIILILYSMTICENLLIISLVSTSQRLQSPMYFFLGHLAFTDIVLITIVLPKFLEVIIREGSTIPYVECLAQFELYGGTVCTESYLLTAMSYDRYLAICKPLHYISMMNAKLRYGLTFSSWILSFTLVSVILSLLAELDFCGSNIINHLFCEFSPILELSCSDTSSVNVNMTVLSVPVILINFTCVMISYIYIFRTIFGISTTSGRQKTFFTCSSHLVAVSIYYVSMFVIYTLPNRGNLLTVNKFISLVFIVLYPLLNPIIYSLRNKEIQASVMKYLRVSG
ncbi:olfactory receptor 6F1-like [Leptodactylus fuscus]|uniref:olfactory receptor 6F1-like n=1 Tax=Leptodactylus fuscus TaxID=238119 RepID=UPI003F4EC050